MSFCKNPIACRHRKRSLQDDSLDGTYKVYILKWSQFKNFKLVNNSNYYVYITTNPGKTVLYTGVTNDLGRRLIEHYDNKGNKKNFAGKYYCYKLIYYEHYPEVNQAIFREKEIKNLTRRKKLELIKTTNPKLNFLII